MSNKDANKENEGTAAPSLNPKNIMIFSTDMTEEMRQNVILATQRAFNSPVNHGKVYQTIADLIRTECEKGSVGVGDGGKEDATDGNVASGGWSCVVGGELP